MAWRLAADEDRSRYSLPFLGPFVPAVWDMRRVWRRRRTEACHPHDAASLEAMQPHELCQLPIRPDSSNAHRIFSGIGVS